jgi:FeS assembly SUF system protein
MFSFLTGKKDGKNAVDAGDAGDVTSGGDASGSARAAATPPVTLPPPSAVATDEPVRAWDTGDDSPFSAPAAWNLDALNAPAPKQEGEVSQAGPLDPAVTAEFQQPIIDVIKTVFDPEIPVDIYELGLIYEIIVDSEKRALIRMTLTSPACPSAQQIPQEVRYKVKAVPGITDAWVEIVWDPPWSKDRMSEVAKLTLGMF